MSQQKAQQLLAHLAQIAHRLGPQPHQVAHRLMRLVGVPYRRQLPGPQRLRQHHGIAPVGLHFVHDLARDRYGPACRELPFAPCALSTWGDMCPGRLAMTKARWGVVPLNMDLGSTSTGIGSRRGGPPIGED